MYKQNKQIFVELGERVRKRRLELGYTQETLAEMLGTSEQTISFTETGSKGLKLENFIKLCSVLETSPDYLITGREPASVIFRDLDTLTDEQYERVSAIIKNCIALCKDEQNKKGV